MNKELEIESVTDALSKLGATVYMSSTGHVLPSNSEKAGQPYFYFLASNEVAYEIYLAQIEASISTGPWLMTGYFSPRNKALPKSWTPGSLSFRLTLEASMSQFTTRQALNHELKNLVTCLNRRLNKDGLSEDVLGLRFESMQ